MTDTIEDTNIYVIFVNGRLYTVKRKSYRLF